VRLISHLHVVPRLRVRGTIPSPQYAFMIWYIVKQEVHKLNIQIRVMWNMKSFILPVTYGATGIVIKGLNIFGSNIRKVFSRISTKEQLY